MIKRLIGQGILPASQVVPSAPWMIQRTALDLATVHAEVQAVHTASGGTYGSPRVHADGAPARVSPLMRSGYV